MKQVMIRAFSLFVFVAAAGGPTTALADNEDTTFTINDGNGTCETIECGQNGCSVIEIFACPREFGSPPQ